jgi:hypothetical protein
LSSHGKIVNSYGHPEAAIAKAMGDPATEQINLLALREKNRALENARRKVGGNARILAASDVAGNGAIAVAKHPNGSWLIAVAPNAF